MWLRPVVGGAAIGAMGVFIPHILGVGYEATDLALWGRLPLMLMLVLIVAKTAATAITLASRFGGGIFSPALYLGAMTGGAYGIIAAYFFPELASSQALYSILGMGAVAGAVLGAPLSTTLIVFELTGGYELSIALLLTTAIAHGLNQAIHGHSYFQWQLEMRGLFVQAGPHRTVIRNVKVMDFMTLLPSRCGTGILRRGERHPEPAADRHARHGAAIFRFRRPIAAAGRRCQGPNQDHRLGRTGEGAGTFQQAPDRRFGRGTPGLTGQIARLLRRHPR